MCALRTDDPPPGPGDGRVPQLRSSALLAQAICQACWRQERNGRGICSGCNRLKVFAVKAERLCKHCHQDRLAPKLLRRDAMSFTSP